MLPWDCGRGYGRSPVHAGSSGAEGRDWKKLSVGQELSHSAWGVGGGWQELSTSWGLMWCPGAGGGRVVGSAHMVQVGGAWG